MIRAGAKALIVLVAVVLVAAVFIVVVGVFLGHTDDELSRWTDWATIVTLALTLAVAVGPSAWRRATGLGKKSGQEPPEEENELPATTHEANPKEAGHEVSEGSELPGRPLVEVTDPFTLEVKHAVEPDAGTSRDLPSLPPYVRRAHDEELACVTRAVIEGGNSRIAVLVGGSSTGKTRACWETLQVIRDTSTLSTPWRLWHPIAPSHPEALIKGLPHVAPYTVIWLNEAQLYLDAPDGVEVCAALRVLLSDSKRAPILVLATLWREYWLTLTSRPGYRASDPHADARELVTGCDISVPSAFDETQLGDLAKADDPRLARAARYAADGEVAQYLASAPELLSHYINASPGPKSLIHAAMDARRLGVRDTIPLEFLNAAAPAYPTDRELNSFKEDWLLGSLAEAEEPVIRVLAPLTLIRRRSGNSSVSIEKQYRLADYLDQYARRARRTIIPPLGFWDACETLYDRVELRELGNAAEARGILRSAARLHRRAAALGDTRAAARLVRRLHQLDPETPDVTQQFLGRISMDEVDSVAELVHELDAAGAVERANELLMSVMESVALEDPRDLTLLLQAARGANEDEDAQARVGPLLARDPATHVSLDNLASVTELAEQLRLVQGTEQARRLMSRAAAEVKLDDPEAVGKAVKIILQLGAAESLAALVARDPASQASLNDLVDLAQLLTILHEAGVEGQVAMLAERIAVVPVDRDNLDDLQALVEELWESGVKEYATALADRASTCGCPDDPEASVLVAKMLDTVGSEEFVSALLERCPVYRADLTDPSAVAELLRALWDAQDEENLAELLERDPVTSVECADPAGVASLLDILMELGAEQLELDLEPLGLAPKQQVETLLARDPATLVSLDLPDSVASLLETMWKARETEQVKVLARRAAEECGYFTGAPRSLLRALRHVGADDEVARLVKRLPAEEHFESFLAEGDNKVVYQFGRDPERGDPATRWGCEDLD